MDLTSQRIAILGAGRSGQAAAALARHLGGIVTVFDDAPAERLSAHLERLRQADLTAVIGSDATALEVRPGQWDLVIISPGIDESWPLPLKFTSVGVPLMGETEFAWRHCLDPLIAITG
ncbi:MAG: hypothetical protein KDK99_15215, partial [Verrucomicrobiales bacterium]|nr:hypothetical protein [Verrucomicrobiales bacterium]